MVGGQSDGDDDAIRALPVIRYLANADLTDPLWRDPRIVPSIFPRPYDIIFDAMVLAWQRELPRTSAIIARCAQDNGFAISESTIEDIIRGAEYVDTTGVVAQVELLIQERDRKAAVARLSTALKALNEPGIDPSPVLSEVRTIGATDFAIVQQPGIQPGGKQLRGDYRSNRPGELQGLSSGLRTLDRITNGFPPQFLTVIGARVSVGKSALAMQFGRLWAMQQIPVMYFSLELTRRMFQGRWLAQQANISFTRWQMNVMTPDETRRLDQAIARNDEVEVDEYLTLYASGELSVPTRDTVIQLVMREPPERRPRAIIIDLMTNLRPVPSERGMQDWQRLDRESEALRDLAIRTNSTVFVVCQLNRDITKRKDKRPQLSDIRASGAIEQNADQVILLDNPDIIGFQERNSILMEQQKMFLNVNKNRNGRAGSTETVWLASPMLIQDTEFSPAAWGTPEPEPAPPKDISDLFE
jgi:hypothetical protein